MMLARVTRARVPTDKLDQGIARFRETILPSLATRRGFLGGLLLIDRTAGGGRTMTFWEDDAALRDSEAMAAEARARVTQESGAQVEEPETYEIVFQHRVVTPRPNVFLRVIDARGSIERVDDLVDLGRDQVLPALKSQPGFLAMQMMANRQNGRSLMMSVWDSAASRERSEAAMRVLREQSAMSMGASSFDVSLYEAVVVELNAAAFPVGASQKAPA